MQRPPRRIELAIFLSVVFGVALVGWLAAWPGVEPAELLVELQPGTEPRGERMGLWLPVGDGIVFSSGRPSGEPRPRVWFSDGTTDGTRLVRDGVDFGSGAVGEVARLPDGRGFIARFSDPTLGSEPWITDGTASGTVPLADLCVGSCSSSVSDVTRAGGRRFFLASDAPGDRRLMSLGPDLEVDVLDIVHPLTATPIYDPAIPAAAGHGEVPDLELLVAVRSTGGERSLQRVALGGGAPQTVWSGFGVIGSLQPFRDGALVTFERSATSTFELIFVDRSGTEVILQSEHQMGVRALHPAVGDEQGFPLAFIALSNGFGQPCEVWRTDGSKSGTWKLGEIPEGLCFDDVEIVGSRVVLSAQAGETFRVVSTDGTVPGLIPLHAADEGYGDRELRELGGYVYWLDEQPAALMRTDGLQPASAVCTFESSGNDFGERLHLPRLGNGLLFTAKGGDGSGMELWRWDGATCGSEPIANLVPDARPARIEGILSRGSRVFVQEQTQSMDGETFQQIWDVDPADATSVLVVEDRTLLGRVGDRLVLQNGDAGFFSGARIYGLDLQSGVEVELLQTFPHSLGRVDNGVFLAEIYPITGYGRVFEALWFSDGTLEGTRRVRSFGNVPGPPGFIPWGRGGIVLLVENQIWRSDGSGAGTVKLFEAESGLSVHGLSDGAVFATEFEFDGPETLLAVDVISGSPRFAEDERLAVNGLGRSAPFRNRLLFFGVLPASGPEGGGAGLWLSDGSTLGTELLGRLNSPRLAGQLRLTAHRGLAFFSASDAQAGGELFVTDGTPGGTRMLMDAIPGIVGSRPTSPMPVDGLLALERSTLEGGPELWLSDGTEEGTRMLEIEPGPLGSVPRHATAVGDKVIFAADRSDVGRELFSLDRADLRSPCRSSATAACVGEGRFQVEADWLDRASNTRGRATAVPFTGDTARFWFFEQDNIELVVKVLDGRVVNDDWWVFYGATSDVDYWVTVTDTWSGRSKSYTNRQGNQCGVNDTSAFDRDPAIDDLLTESTGSAVVAPVGSTHESETLSLQDGRFEARVRYFVDGVPGSGLAIPDTEQAGYFWFFDPANVELIVKVLDGRSINGHWWVYHGGLSDLRYELEITDTETGAVWRDENPAKSICGGSDVEAFGE